MSIHKRSCRSILVWIGAACLLVCTATACNTTYTEAELRREEPQRDAEEQKEEKRDRQIGEEGGANREALGDQAWEVERQSER